MFTKASQRWRERRTSFVTDRSFINPAIHSVDVISCHREAKLFIEQHHYSASFPATRLSCGLFRNSAGGSSALVGVASFSVSMNPAAGPKNTGLSGNASVELGRLVLLDHVEANAESWFVSRAFKMLRQEKPEIEAVYAYADPVIRRDGEGGIILPGHVGSVYAALNSKCLGRGTARTLQIMANGHVASERSLSKIRNDERGREYATRQLLAAGAPQRAKGEDPRDWLRRLSREGFLRKTRHPGNWIYSFPLTRSARRAANDLVSVDPPKRDPLISDGDVSRIQIPSRLAA